MDYADYWKRLTRIYETSEAKSIVRLVLEQRFGLSLTDIACGRVGELSADERQALEGMMQRLEKGEPVQYVLGVAEFGGRTFHVEPGVLIPRPETYELCQWVMASPSLKKLEEKILDIGTGSGCIACTLAAELPNAKVKAWDISDDALRIAQGNASRLGVQVSFEQVDVLNLPPITHHPTPNTHHPTPNTHHLTPNTHHPSPNTHHLTPNTHHLTPTTLYDAIVSNPPYICNKERAKMERNVLDFEPELALFVPDEDPLLFYVSIARYAAQALNSGGELYFEINPLYAREMVSMLETEGFSDIETRRDMFGKERFTKARKR